MKRLYAGKFLAVNSFPERSKSELRNEKNKINGVISYAIGRGLNCNSRDEVDTIDFLRWAANKKNKGVLRWPWLEDCLNLPPIPNSFSGTLLKVEQSVIPVDIKECQNLLVKVWQELADKQKKINELTKEVEELRVKRQDRVIRGKEAAAKQWKNN